MPPVSGANMIATDPLAHHIDAASDHCTKVFKGVFIFWQCLPVSFSATS
jgi:hypothetical protein